MTRDAEVSAGDFLSLVLSGIESESDVGVTSGVLRQLTTALDQFAAPMHREEYKIRLAQACEGFATRAEAGSDHQLAFTKVFIANATTEPQLHTVSNLFDGTVVWEGLTVDTDLRWTMLQTLVAAGVKGDPDIDAELSSDNTATGIRQATVARAARPTREAKEEAWDSVLNNTKLPNTIIEATISGFQDPNQPALMRSFVDRYFSELPAVWEKQTTEMAQDITSGMYPATVPSVDLVAKTNEFLSAQSASGESARPTMIRLVTEARDGIERALRAQAKDAN
jgi:aminopeptidase N